MARGQAAAKELARKHGNKRGTGEGTCSPAKYDWGNDGESSESVHNKTNHTCTRARARARRLQQGMHSADRRGRCGQAWQQQQQQQQKELREMARGQAAAKEMARRHGNKRGTVEAACSPASARQHRMAACARIKEIEKQQR